eukprot:UN2486
MAVHTDSTGATEAKVDRDWDADAQTALLHMAVAESASQEMVLSLMPLMEGETPREVGEVIRFMLAQQQSTALEAQRAMMLEVEEAKTGGPAAALDAIHFE